MVRPLTQEASTALNSPVSAQVRESACTLVQGVSDFLVVTGGSRLGAAFLLISACLRLEGATLDHGSDLPLCNVNKAPEVQEGSPAAALLLSMFKQAAWMKPL